MRHRQAQGQCAQEADGGRRKREHRSSQQQGDGGISLERQFAIVRNPQQERRAGDERKPVSGRRRCACPFGRIAGAQSPRRRLAGDFHGRRQRAGHGEHDAQQQEQRQRHGLDVQVRLQLPEISGAQVDAAGGQQARGKQPAGSDADDAAHGADRGALGQQQAQHRAPRNAQRAQQGNLRAPPEYRQGLRRMDDEGAGEQGDQRQHVEIGPVGAGQRRAAPVFRVGGQGVHARRQQALQRPLRRQQVGPGFQADIDAMQRAGHAETPLRRGDVHDAQRLPVGAIRQDRGDAQPQVL